MGSLQEDIQDLNKALVNQDNRSIETIGHKMVDAGKTDGSKPFSEIGADLEAAATEKNQDTIKQKINELSIYLERIETV